MFGIVYSKNTGRIRMIIYPDFDYQLDQLNLNDGEILEKLDKSKFADLITLQKYISEKTNLYPQDDRYVVVDKNTNEIKGAILADPLCGDSIDGCDLIKHKEADKNWDFNKTTQTFVNKIPIKKLPKEIQDLIDSLKNK